MNKNVENLWRYCGQDRIPKFLQKAALGNIIKERHMGKPCKCGFIWNVSDGCPVAQVIRGDWGDDYPAIRIENPGAIGEKAEPYMEKIVYGSIDDVTADANIRLMVQAPAMQALLEWTTLILKAGKMSGITAANLYDDIKTLLKKVKEVK